MNTPYVRRIRVFETSLSPGECLDQLKELKRGLSLVDARAPRIQSIELDVDGRFRWSFAENHFQFRIHFNGALVETATGTAIVMEREDIPFVREFSFVLWASALAMFMRIALGSAGGGGHDPSEALGGFATGLTVMALGALFAWSGWRKGERKYRKPAGLGEIFRVHFLAEEISIVPVSYVSHPTARSRTGLQAPRFDRVLKDGTVALVLAVAATALWLANFVVLILDPSKVHVTRLFVFAWLLPTAVIAAHCGRNQRRGETTTSEHAQYWLLTPNAIAFSAFLLVELLIFWTFQ